MRLLLQFLLASNFRRFLCVQAETLTVKQALDHWENVFKTAKIPEPENSAGYIVAHVIGEQRISDALTRQDEPLTKAQSKELKKLCSCRLSRMPVQYIIKNWDFRGLTLIMAPPVFIPRPETEELIDIILEHIKKKDPKAKRFLEVGCGTGAISLSLLNECSQLSGMAVDKSFFAYKLTISNAMLHDAKELQISYAELKEDGYFYIANVTNKRFTLKEEFDFIVSNPPYIPTKNLSNLQEEIILYEDLRALDGGDDGMRIIIPIMILAAKHLKQNGSLFLEIDPSEPKLIENWIKINDHYKLKLKKVYKDFNDEERFVHIIKE